jgi:hypothetical protein
MNLDIIDKFYGKWIKAGHLLVDLSSMETGFNAVEKNRRAIWDYIEWRETVLVGSPDPSCRSATLI